MKTLSGFLAILLSIGLAKAGDRQLWQIGQADDSYAEFALSDQVRPKWDYAWDWRRDVTFVVGESDVRRDWPFIHPGPEDGWARALRHTNAVRFGLKDAPQEGDCRLEVRLIDTHERFSPTLRVNVNGTIFDHATPKGGGDDSALGKPAQGKRHAFKVTFPAGLLHAGNNQIAISNILGSWCLYDSVTLTTPADASLAKLKEERPPTVMQLAKPEVGTSGVGHTFPGACVPFGMVQLSPDTRTGSWPGCAGYQGADRNILGFSHNHLSGTGCTDLGNILLMPAVGPVDLVQKGDSGFAKPFSNDLESMSPGYYRVIFPEEKITVELTATARAGLHRYTFPASEQSHVLFDLAHGIGSDTRETVFNVENDHTVSGLRKYNGWGGAFAFYFVAEFSKPFTGVKAVIDGQPRDEGKEFKGRRVRAGVTFATRDKEQVLVKVGLSAVSIEGARKNLAAELPGFDFDKTHVNAQAAWQKVFDKIEVKSGDRAVLENFYSALYHSCIAPVLHNDVDGSFAGPDGKVHPSPGHDYYTMLSCWDVFRAQTPLLSVLEPRRMEDICKTMLTHYQNSPDHCLPVWVNAGRENWCMIGIHSIPILTDAYRKGIRGFDTNLALKAMNDSMALKTAEMDEYRRLGYITRRPGRQCSSRTLELSYNDSCIARFADAIGQAADATESRKRANNWKNLFDPTIGFMRGRSADGGFAEPFDPLKVDFDDFTEATAWHYLFFVPHDVPGLVERLGGDAAFCRKIDEMFDSPSGILTSQPDITGLIGMYCHGNEPDEQVPFLYSLAGQPWKSQQRSRQVMTTLYDASRDGLPGNDDCGQISAWYVWSAMGLYPVDPTSGIYVLGSPALDEATIRLDPKYAKGRTFKIVARNNSAKNIYIQSATLNGKPLDRAWISHEDMVEGGELILNMGAGPNFSALGGKRP